MFANILKLSTTVVLSCEWKTFICLARMRWWLFTPMLGMPFSCSLICLHVTNLQLWTADDHLLFVWISAHKLVVLETDMVFINCWRKQHTEQSVPNSFARYAWLLRFNRIEKWPLTEVNSASQSEYRLKISLA